jgi:predicted nucleic acid-binding protein
MSKVLVDTCIWSSVLRRQKSVDLQIRKTMTSLIEEGRVSIIGPIRQELLSGIKSQKQFNEIREKLSAFEDDPISSEIYELAAQFNNTCRSKGVQGSHIDYLICAVAKYFEMEIYTTDQDFKRYQKHIEINVFNQETYLK